MPSSSFQQQQVSPRRPRRPCAAGGCSFFGSPETLDMCSVCYKKLCLAAGPGGANSAATAAPRSAVAVAAATAAAPRSAVAAAAAAPIDTPPASSTAANKPVASLFAPPAVVVAEAAVTLPSSGASPAKKAQPTRCAACYKKVGLTGFVCRCSKTFCGTHRYAEEHGCSFDFKGAGRDAIARNNPLVKGEKLAGKI